MSEQSKPPEAEIVLERRWTLAWILPVLAVGLVVYLGTKAWSERGHSVRVRFEQGHGIKVGDGVRYRGIQVGEVSEVRLDETLQLVIMELALVPQAQALPRVGTRFWIVRPQVSLAGIAGLETIVGAHYLEVLPGPPNAPQQYVFEGLEDPPVLENLKPGGLEVVLHSSRRGSLTPATPIHYRQIPVGRVLSVGLASDSNSVEARAYVEPAYAALVRESTRFWRTSGVDMQMDLRGFRIKTESLQTLAAGGIALSTPPDGGAAVGTGHRFQLEEAAEDEWERWRPSVPMGSALLKSGASLPRPLRATLSWEEGRIFTGQEEASGWALILEEGLLCPLDLLIADEDADEGSVNLQVAGERLDPNAELAWNEDGLGCLPGPWTDGAWQRERIRRATAPEDCLLVGDPAGSPLALAAARLSPEGRGWRLDPSLPVDSRWHGAAVVARSDGALVGMLLVDDEGGLVSLLSPH